MDIEEMQSETLHGGVTCAGTDDRGLDCSETETLCVNVCCEIIHCVL